MKPTAYLNPFEVYRRRALIGPWVKHRILDARGLLAMHGLPLDSNRRRLGRLRDRHAGEVGYLIGNGPSVRLDDLERLAGKPAFCANRFYLCYPNTAFRPLYTVSSDRQMIEDFGQEIVDRCESKAFICTEWPISLRGDYYWLRLRNTRPWSRPERLQYYLYQTGATPLAALQLGMFMGIRRFVAYGMDHQFQYRRVENPADPARSAIGEGNHFIANYRSGSPWAPPQFDLIENSFRYYDALLRSQGGWILNATRGGQLDVIERVDFDAIASDPSLLDAPRVQAPGQRTTSRNGNPARAEAGQA